MARQAKKKKNKTPVKPRSVRSAKSPQEISPRDIAQALVQNQPGLVGFLLSLLQLLGHTSWILWVWYLSTTGKALRLNSDSWTSWGIVGILGFSMILTFVSLFVCLFYGLRRPPRTLAVIGFCMSFFVGAMASGLVFMQGIRSMSGK